MSTKSIGRRVWTIFLVLFLFSGTLLMASGGDGEHAKVGLLDVKSGLVVWTIVAFAVTFLILKKLAWKPLLASLQNREDRIRNSLEEAEQAREQAEKMLKDYEEKLTTAKAEVKDLIAKGRKDAEAAKENLLKEANDECQRIKERSQQELKLTKEKAVKEIFDLAGDLAVSISTKLIQKTLDKKVQDEIIKDGLDKFKSLKSLN